MDPQLLFSIATYVAMAGWIILLVFPRWQAVDKVIVGMMVTLLAVFYVVIIFTHFRLSDLVNFNSLQGVKGLFANEWVLLAGWIHYLAFDLLTGLFIRKNAGAVGVSNWLVFPSLLLTFMLGPAGLLFYLIARWIVTHNYFEENY